MLGNIALFHDLGKYSSFFQDYLLELAETNSRLKVHSQFGATYFLSHYFERDPFMAILGYSIIVQHHGNLQNLMSIRSHFTKNEFRDRSSILEKQQKSMRKYASQINAELRIDNIENFQNGLDPTSVFRAIKKLQKESDIKNYFMVNCLFSLLIEADKLDASDTKVYELVSLAENKVDIDKGVPTQLWDEEALSFSDLTLNQLRDLVRKRVINNLENINIFDRKIFTLTAPTGIGKTLTAFDFALKLRKLIREKENREAQIIYALPFINIIEQAYAVYCSLFKKDEAKILAHYQYADALNQQDDKSDDEYNSTSYEQKIMSFDTWQCDIVITTFVQFLQTLIGNRNKLLKKFNHFAGSIIILDEVQTIALKQLPLVGAALYYLSKYLGSYIIVMTATKPKLFELANTKILANEGEEVNPIELLGSDDDVAKIFRSFNRTKICPKTDKILTSADDFVEKYFDELWDCNRSCLVVVNTVNLSIEVFNSIKKYLKKNKHDNPLYYISTNIIPAERLKLIETIKNSLKSAKSNNSPKPILISTQCVEAGVDLDFDMAFRDLAPIDSIIQVAGRVNREYDKSTIGPVYIVDFNKCGRIYGPMTDSTVKNSLQHFTQEKSEILEKEYLDLVSYYYDNICERNNDGFEYAEKIFNSMKKLDYDGNDYSVSKFQSIENDFNTISIFIEYSDKATMAKQMFEKLIRQECTRENFEPYKLDFHQSIIAVPDYLINTGELEKLTEDILFVPKYCVDQYYNSETGFIRNETDTSCVISIH